jgi:WD40 repeat protein
MCKLEGICIGHTKSITSLTFLEKYPVLISTGSDGVVNFWGIRRCPIDYRYQCIARFVNKSYEGMELRDSGICSF